MVTVKMIHSIHGPARQLANNQDTIFFARNPFGLVMVTVKMIHSIHGPARQLANDQDFFCEESIWTCYGDRKNDSCLKWPSKS